MLRNRWVLAATPQKEVTRSSITGGGQGKTLLEEYQYNLAGGDGGSTQTKRWRLGLGDIAGE